MRRNEVIAIAAVSVAAAAVLSVLALRCLPVMPVSSISSGVTLTPSAKRVLYPSLGRFYPSLERSAMISELSALPYLDDISISYDSGSLVIGGKVSDGVLVSADDGFFFSAGDTLIPLESGDAAVLSEELAVISGDIPVSEGRISDPLVTEVIKAVAGLGDEARLISWMEYVNNSPEESSELAISLKDLNAIITLRDSSAARRIGESIALIISANRSEPGRTIFSPAARYELYSDRLERLKG